jgi:hypothetical protein
LSRIVLTVATGDEKYVRQALGLARSLSFVGDLTRRVVISDSKDPALNEWFDEVVSPSADSLPFLQKLHGLSVSNADEVLFIDSDSIVFGKLDRIWEACSGASFAVQGNWIQDDHWYGWLENVLPSLGLHALPMFNGGLIYYSRTAGTFETIEAANRVARAYGQTGLETFRGTVPDEPCLAIAMARTGHFKLLPDTVDFMNTAIGLVGKLDIDVRRRRCRFLKFSRHGLRFIEPTIFHAGKYVNNTVYWKQLSRLEAYEKYSRKHPFGYMPPLHKLRRSLERRILKLMGKL